ncbi:hypothetical protein M407DRAFT_23885 [Tulasnella calospora MUT 4182]|uniref:F-box domain-containing protein n=1 Tax=Tulasnella calospora MUT 4182 TaxID=1051891 RepID=A0A0C3KZJ0_9AGAM|nr:hypothetical protein M407DRAFT_23885 [Tulasnella calospora MUT 4182]
MALRLDRIHDYDLPLDDLERHRRQLLNMRCVSVGWNAFLLSSPEYWCAIDVAAPEPVVESILARAKQTPLCLYLKRGSPRGSPSLFGRSNSVLSGYTTQVRTIRSDGRDEDACDLAGRMLRGGLPDLQTLELAGDMDWEFMGEEFFPEYTKADLPGIRHLIAVGWLPGAEAMWHQNLQTLILKPPLRLSVDVLRILSACHNLSKLVLHANDGPDSAEDMAGAPPLIDLPCLQEMDIEVDLPVDAGFIAPILHLPSHCRRFLRIRGVFQWAPPSDICRFLYSHTGGSSQPPKANIEIYHNSTNQSRATYTFSKGGLDLCPGRLTSGEYDEFRALMQAVQACIKNTQLSVRLRNPNEGCLSTLRKLADLNVTEIWVECTGRVGTTDLLDILGSNYPVLPSDVAEDEEWPFESLRELIIKGASVDISYLTRMIRIRRRYLRKFSKTWLEKVTLVDRSPYGTKIEQAITQMAAMGVTLVNSDGGFR